MCVANEEVAKLQDLLIYVTKGISEIVVKGKVDVKSISEVNHEVLKAFLSLLQMLILMTVQSKIKSIK